MARSFYALSWKLESGLLVLLSATLTVGLASFAYLGIFSRTLADDYCIADLLNGNFLINLWNNYLTVSDRFSNYIFIAASESIWPRSDSLLPAILLVGWTVGLVWLLKEVNTWTGQNWTLMMRVVLALTLVFFTILQVPNRYQTLYWRASSAAHLVPLVLMPYIFAYLSLSIRSSADRPTTAWTFTLLFLSFFFVSDFSEPSAAVINVLLGTAIIFVLFWGKEPSRKQAIYSLGWAMAGALTALVIMAASPANSLRLGTPPPPIPLLVIRSVSYTYDFILEAIRIRPLPILVSILIPFLISLAHSNKPVALPAVNKDQIISLFLTVAVPILAFILIAASFAPSVYGQGYPLERARLSGIFIFSIAFMVEGALLGIFLNQWQPGFVDHKISVGIRIVFLCAVAFYSLRAGWLTLADRPEYQDRANTWDEREIYINDLTEQGNTDLLIPQMDGIYGIKELDVDAGHWVNRCAAFYYNVNSIRAIPPDDS